MTVTQLSTANVFCFIFWFNFLKVVKRTTKL